MEDHPDVRDILALQLLHMGHEATVATNGARAINKAIAELPDVIILDLNLPDMSGVEVAAILKHHSATSAIPILVYTGLVGGEWRDRALKAGARDYLTKPTPPSILGEMIRKLTDEKPRPPSLLD